MASAEQFSWVDHRLVRERRLQRCPAEAWALYLFLLTVGAAQGLSYYSAIPRYPSRRARLKGSSS